MRHAVIGEARHATAEAPDGTVDLARDRDLVERCQRGDETAFAELYDRYHRRLFRSCVRRLHDPVDAEEAVQEAFTKAWRALPRFAGERRFYPWLSVIAGNVCTDVLRRRARLVPMDELPLPTLERIDDDVDAGLLRQVDLAMATEALTHLSERHQRVLRLREAAGWSTQRIAEQEGVAVPAVDTLLWRARQAFRREFVALAESAGQLAALAGFSVVALRRFGIRHLARLGVRVLPRLPLPAGMPAVRSPGVLAASAALTGAALAGGGIALVTTTVHHPSAAASASAAAATATATGARVPGSGDAETGSGATGSSTGAPAGAGAGSGSATQVGGGGGGTTGTLPSGVPSSPSLPGLAGTALGSTVNGVAQGTGATVNGATEGAGAAVSGALRATTSLLQGATQALSPSASTPTTTVGLGQPAVTG